MAILSFFSKSIVKSSTPIPETGTDFTSMISRLTRPGGGWKPVGYGSDGSYIVQSEKTGRLEILRAEDMNLKRLVVKLGQEARKFCRIYDPKLKKEVEVASRLTAAISEGCDALGLFDFGRVRGPGLYRDGRELIVHYGDNVRMADGRAVSVEPGKTGPVYEGGASLGFTASTPAASDADVARLVDAFKSFGTKKVSDVVVLVGWLTMAMYGSALECHPILALTAERGSGKSTLIGLLARLLGPQAIRRDGVPAVAQVLYDLENRTAALLLDEVEGTARNLRAFDAISENLRIGFDEKDEQNIARVIGGKLRKFNAPTGAVLVGIGLPDLNAATANRAIRVFLDALPERSRTHCNALLQHDNADEVRALGARIKVLLLKRWPIMLQTMEALTPMLLGMGYEARTAKMYVTLLAGYVTLTHNAAPAAVALQELVEQLQLKAPQEVAVERDAELCLGWILDRKVAIFDANGSARTTTHVTIRDALLHILHGEPSNRLQLVQQLEEFGIRPVWVAGSGQWKLAVCSSAKHDGMRRLMQRTDWVLGGWKDVLMRLPGAEAGVQKVARVSQRVVLLDMPAELLEMPTPEVYEFPETPERAQQAEVETVV